MSTFRMSAIQRPGPVSIRQGEGSKPSPKRRPSKFPSEHPHWIERLAVMERERRADIDAFQLATSEFFAILTQALRSGIDAFNHEFPPNTGAGISEIDRDKGIISIKCLMYKPETIAIIRFLSPAFEMSCEYSHAYPHEDWSEGLQASALGLRWQGLAREDAATELAKKILRPVLFPLLEIKS
jgi:hypothetical protein